MNSNSLSVFRVLIQHFCVVGMLLLNSGCWLFSGEDTQRQNVIEGNSIPKQNQNEITQNITSNIVWSFGEITHNGEPIVGKN